MGKLSFCEGNVIGKRPKQIVRRSDYEAESCVRPNTEYVVNATPTTDQRDIDSLIISLLSRTCIKIYISKILLLASY
jgi:hypothetical protein